GLQVDEAYGGQAARLLRRLLVLRRRVVGNELGGLVPGLARRPHLDQRRPRAPRGARDDADRPAFVLGLERSHSENDDSLSAMRHPVSTIARSGGGERLRGAMSADVVWGAVLPAAPENAGPRASEDPDRVLMATPTRTRALIHE